MMYQKKDENNIEREITEIIEIIEIREQKRKQTGKLSREDMIEKSYILKHKNTLVKNLNRIPPVELKNKIIKNIIIENDIAKVKLINEKKKALMYASVYGNTEIVKLLIEKEGIDVNIQDNDGNTALILASKNGHIGIVDILIDEKLDILYKLKKETEIEGKLEEFRKIKKETKIVLMKFF